MDALVAVRNSAMAQICDELGAQLTCLGRQTLGKRYRADILADIAKQKLQFEKDLPKHLDDVRHREEQVEFAKHTRCRICVLKHDHLRRQAERNPAWAASR